MSDFPRAEFAYIDDSGDPGMVKGSRTFALGCVLVPLDEWTERLDKLNAMRREVREIYGVRLRDEVKGEWLAGVKKHFRDLGLGDRQLRDIYIRHMLQLHQVSSGAFGIVILKDEITKRESNPEQWAWEYLLQRLRMRTRETGAPILIVHDQTSKYAELRKHVRRFRRHTWTAANTPDGAPLIIEDPISRDSQHSYFIQLADLVAYSTTRYVSPTRGRNGFICPNWMWDVAGNVRLTAVNSSSSAPNGIVVWPPTKKGGPLSGSP